MPDNRALRGRPCSPFARDGSEAIDRHGQDSREAMAAVALGVLVTALASFALLCIAAGRVRPLERKLA